MSRVYINCHDNTFVTKNLQGTTVSLLKGRFYSAI